METMEFRWLNYDQQLIEVRTNEQILVKNYEEVLSYCYENKLFDTLQNLTHLATQPPKERPTTDPVESNPNVTMFRWLNYDQQLIEVKTGDHIVVRNYADALDDYFANEWTDELQALEQLATQFPSQKEAAKQIVEETNIDGEYMELCDCDPINQSVLYLDNDYNEMDTFDFFGHILHDSEKTTALETLHAFRRTGLYSLDLEQVLAQFVKFTEYKTDRRQQVMDECYRKLPLEQAMELAQKEVWANHVGSDLGLSLALRGLLETYEVDVTLILLEELGQDIRYGCGYLDPITEDYRVIDIKSLFETICQDDIVSLSLTELSTDSKNYLLGKTNINIVDEQSADCVEQLSSQPLTTVLECLEADKEEPQHTLRYINEYLSSLLYQKKYTTHLWEKGPHRKDFASMVSFAKDQIASGSYDTLTTALLLAEQAANNDLDHWLIKYGSCDQPLWGNLVIEYGNCYICTKGEATYLYQHYGNQPVTAFTSEIQDPAIFCKNHPEALVYDPYFLDKTNLDDTKQSTIKLSDFTHTLVYQTRMEQTDLEDDLLGIPKRIRKRKK